MRRASRIAATRSGARGFRVRPGFALGEVGSPAAIFRALAAETPSMAAARFLAGSFWGGVRPLAGWAEPDLLAGDFFAGDFFFAVAMTEQG